MPHLEKQWELSGLEAPGELQINTLTQHATQQNSEKPEPTCHYCKKLGQLGHYQNQCRQPKREKNQARNITNKADNNNMLISHSSVLISHSRSTIFDKKRAVRVTNTTESPYLIKNNTQNAEFSVVTPEQSKHNKPVDMAVLSMIP